MITALARRFSVDGVSLAWDRWGADEGTPFLLCHGFSGSTHDFSLSIEGFARLRPVVAIDHRGHGRSEKLGALDRYSGDRLTADLIEFIDTEVGQPVDLLGHSMGGAISLRLALARPDLVRSLILMDTSGWSFAPEDAAMASLMADFLQAYDPASASASASAAAPPSTSSTTTSPPVAEPVEVRPVAQAQPRATTTVAALVLGSVSSLAFVAVLLGRRSGRPGRTRPRVR